MSNLSEQQINSYRKNGYVSPIDILSTQEAKEVREEIEIIENKYPDILEGIGRNYVHIISPIFNKICLNNKMLDAVESIIGKNILICGINIEIYMTSLSLYFSPMNAHISVEGNAINCTNNKAIITELESSPKFRAKVEANAITV